MNTETMSPADDEDGDAVTGHPPVDKEAARIARREQLAAEASERIRTGQHWLDWMYIADGIADGRNLAMRKAHTNHPMGATYNRAFGEWMSTRPWARDLDKPTRTHLVWCHENRSEIEAWRATLSDNDRAKINHPTTMKRRFEAAMVVKEQKLAGDKPPTKAEVLEQQLMERDAQIRKLQASAESGSLFDLKRDTVEDIASVIVANIGSSRLAALAKLLTAKTKKPAG